MTGVVCVGGVGGGGGGSGGEALGGLLGGGGDGRVAERCMGKGAGSTDAGTGGNDDAASSVSSGGIGSCRGGDRLGVADWRREGAGRSSRLVGTPWRRADARLEATFHAHTQTTRPPVYGGSRRVGGALAGRPSLGGGAPRGRYIAGEVVRHPEVGQPCSFLTKALHECVVLGVAPSVLGVGDIRFFSCRMGHARHRSCARFRWGVWHGALLSVGV